MYKVFPKQQRTLIIAQRKSTAPAGPVASHELHLPWNLDVWYGLYQQEWYEEDDEE